MASAIDLDALGAAVAKALYVNASLMFVASGVQLFMCLYALSVLLEAPTDTRRRRRPYLIVSFIVFSLFSCSTALDAFYMQDIQFEAKAGSDIINSMILNGEPRHWARRASSLAMLGFVGASDGVLVFRCYVLCKDKLWFIVPPIGVYVVSIILGIITFAGHHPNLNILSGAWTLTAVLVNILATSIIAVRLMQASKLARGASTHQNGVGLYEDLINILVDSALPPTIFGIFYGSSTIIHLWWTQSDTHGAIILFVLKIISSFLYFSSVALSPQTIMFRVSTGTVPPPTNNTLADSQRPTIPLTFSHIRSTPSTSSTTSCMKLRVEGRGKYMASPSHHDSLVTEYARLV